MKKDIKIGNLKSFLDINGLDPEVILERKSSVFDIKIKEDEERTAIFCMSKPTSDMDGDILLPQGVDLSRYKNNSPVLWAHAHSELPIGVASEIASDENGVYSKIKFGDTEFCKDLWSLIKLGAVKMCSVGFIPLEAVVRGTKEFDRIISEKSLKVLSSTRRIITKWLLLENSIVNLGCNNDALLQAVSSKSLNLDEITKEKLGIEEKMPEETKPEEKVPEKEPVAEIEVEVKVEEPKKEEVPVIVVPPKVEEPKPPERHVTIIRHGGYVPDEKDLRIAKAIRRGKIV